MDKKENVHELLAHLSMCDNQQVLPIRAICCSLQLTQSHPLTLQHLLSAELEIAWRA